jgi:hypothetical protein
MAWQALEAIRIPLDRQSFTRQFIVAISIPVGGSIGWLVPMQVTMIFQKEGDTKTKNREQLSDGKSLAAVCATVKFENAFDNQVRKFSVVLQML